MGYVTPEWKTTVGKHSTTTADVGRRQAQLYLPAWLSAAEVQTRSAVLEPCIAILKLRKPHQRYILKGCTSLRMYL